MRKRNKNARQESVGLILHVVVSTHEISARAFLGVAARDSSRIVSNRAWRGCADEHLWHVSISSSSLVSTHSQHHLLSFALPSSHSHLFYLPASVVSLSSTPPLARSRANGRYSGTRESRLAPQKAIQPTHAHDLHAPDQIHHQVHHSSIISPSIFSLLCHLSWVLSVSAKVTLVLDPCSTRLEPDS